MTASDQAELRELAFIRSTMLGQWMDQLQSSARASEPLRLTRFGQKGFSQADEDGIIAEIFRRIGTTDRRFVEFGVQSGVECNTALLLAGGWSGLWMDGSQVFVDSIQRTHAHAINAGKLIVKRVFVTRENIDANLRESFQIAGSNAQSMDFLSIDIDRNDYWVWEQINCIRPRVVAIEYNASYPPPVHFTVPYAANEVWDGHSNYGGASLSALERLGFDKGYALVGCSLSGVNAFFVRFDQLAAPGGALRFHAPFTAFEHFEPARFQLIKLKRGHTPRIGPNALNNHKA